MTRNSLIISHAELHVMSFLMNTFEIYFPVIISPTWPSVFEGVRGSFSPSAPAARRSVRCVCYGGRRWRCSTWLFLSGPFWISVAWEEEEECQSVRQGGREVTEDENLPAHHPNSVVIFTATTFFLSDVAIFLFWCKSVHRICYMSVV